MEETSVTAYLRVPRCTSKAQPKSSSFSSEMLFSPAGYEPVDFYVCALVCMCVWVGSTMFVYRKKSNCFRNVQME